MKKFLLAVTLVCCVFGCSLTAMAAEPEVSYDNPYRSIQIRQEDGSSIETGLTAFISKHEVLVPFALVTDYLKGAYIVERGEGSLFLRINEPQFSMESEALTEFMRSGVDFAIKGTWVEGQPYANLKPLEKLLNIAFEVKKDGQTLLVSKQAVLPMNKLHQPRAPFKPAGKIALVWDHILSENVDLASEGTISGLTVISPTWFAVSDSRGTVASKAQWKYVQDAHDKGYKVWALISNSFDPDMTQGFFADDSAQDRAIRQILMYTALYDLDGINVDFENVYDSDKDRMTAFVARLSEKLRQQGVVVSFDATVPSGTPNWSACYDREGIGKVVDYFMVMTYDEHWRTSPVAGSVASIGWVEQGIINTLAMVPKEKLLMGVPFYTREWRDYGGYVRSSTMWMSDVDARIAEYGLTPVWMEDIGQHYIEYERDGVRRRVWVEDAKSLSLKVAMVGKYNLAGVAAWRKGFEKPGIWEAVLDGVGKGVTVADKKDQVDKVVQEWSLKNYMDKARKGNGKTQPQ